VLAEESVVDLDYEVSAGRSMGYKNAMLTGSGRARGKCQCFVMRNRWATYSVGEVPKASMMVAREGYSMKLRRGEVVVRRGGCGRC
jgi:hypothetical protein